jgi:uncharacterized protein DUF3617
MRALALAGIAVLAVCSAAADQLSDATVEVKPGQYKWNQETTIIGFINKKEENLECLIPQKAKMTLSQLARDLDESCRVQNVVNTGGTDYSFKLVCKGDIPIKADATLSSATDRLNIRANGSATVVGIIPASVSASAKATYMGECTPEEFAKETERWNKEHPQNGG